MTSQNQANTELDTYFPRNDTGKVDIDAAYADFEMQISATLDELAPGANAGKRKAILQAACGTAELRPLFDKNPADFWAKKIAAFIVKIDKNPKTAQPTKEAEEEVGDETDYVSPEESTVKTEPQPTPAQQVNANLDNLAEAPFSATVKVWHKQYNVEVLLTVRSSMVSDGVKRLETVLDTLLGDGGRYASSRTPNEAPSTADRRVGPTNAPPTVPPGSALPQNTPAPAPSPVKSFDPDVQQTGGIQHAEINQIEKVTAKDGKVEIDLYPVLEDGKQAQYAMFYLKSDADKELVYALVNVDAMQLATRYDFPATVDYELSKKLNSKGNPYRNIRAIHPKAK